MMCPQCEKKDELIRQLTERVIAQAEILVRRAELPNLRSFQPTPPRHAGNPEMDAYIDCLQRGAIYG